MKKLIVMEDVPGLADKLKDLASFLTVARKLGYSVYTFFTSSIWKKHPGEWFYPRRKYINFSRDVACIKLFPTIRTKNYGLIGFSEVFRVKKTKLL